MEQLKYIADPRKLCKCGAEMHWCHANRQSGHIESNDSRMRVYKGCAAKGCRHPAENVWLCLWCDISVPA